MKNLFYIMLVLSLLFTGTAMADVVQDSSGPLAVQDGAAAVSGSGSEAVSGSGSEAVSGSVIEDNSTTQIYDRKFINAGITPIPNQIAFMVQPTGDVSFRSIRDIMAPFVTDNQFCIVISDGALRNMAKGGDVETHLHIIRGEDQAPRVYSKDFKNTRYLYLAIEEPVMDEKKTKVLYTKKIPGLIPTGLMDSAADDGDTNSIQVVGKAGLKALADGNNYMVVTKEGHHRNVEAHGWGIGFYLANGNVSGDGKHSSTGGGGTGYAWNASKAEDEPWIHGYVGVKMP